MSLTTNQENTRTPVKTRILYFFLIIFPYAISLCLLILRTNYSLFIKIPIIIALVLTFQTIGTKNFIKKVGVPYRSSFKNSILLFAQYVVAIILAYFLVLVF